MKNIAIFGSGSGTNFEAIVRAIENNDLKANLVLCFSDKKNAYILERAKNHNIKSFSLVQKDFASKEIFEEEILKELKNLNVDYIVLAGYMRLIGKVLLSAYAGRIINIHPSILPAFQGKEAIERSYEYGCKVMGITIHYVDEGMDTGKIIAQEVFQVKDMTLEEAEAKIHETEHKLYPQVLKQILEESK